MLQIKLQCRTFWIKTFVIFLVDIFYYHPLITSHCFKRIRKTIWIYFVTWSCYELNNILYIFMLVKTSLQINYSIVYKYKNKYNSLIVPTYTCTNTQKCVLQVLFLLCLVLKGFVLNQSIYTSTLPLLYLLHILESH